MQLQARHIAIVTCLPVCLSVRQSHSCTMRKRLGSPSYFCITWQNRLFHIKYLYKTPTDFKSDIDIESVQRRFTKRLRFLNNMSHSQRLMTLGLETLEVRRSHQDLLLTYKIVFGLINIGSSRFSLYCDIIVLHVGTILNCSSVIVGSMWENTSFCQRVVEKWNKLPARDNDFCSITAFKRLLIWRICNRQVISVWCVLKYNFCVLFIS